MMTYAVDKCVAREKWLTVTLLLYKVVCMYCLYCYTKYFHAAFLVFYLLFADPKTVLT